ncbi:MAG TPA: tripartite tricarboxylate transporter TctB family protein [Beijerinckiaceae bacterium]|nr:tripartite tricarboxylate transporter TctB family protein [Beijerinckiaceae bacterium]
MPVEVTPSEARRGRIRSPQGFVAGLGLIGLGLFAIWASSELSQGTLRAMGPAMMPRWLAIGVVLSGLALVALAVFKPGEALQRWSLRGPLLVCAAIVAFALTIRVVGLAVAGPLAMIIGGFATPEVRWRELVIFTAVMTAFCVLLFRYMLKLPIPILIVPGVIHV